MEKIEELITTKSPLCETIGFSRRKYDFSMDYAQYLSFSKDVDNKRTTSEPGRITYYLKNGGNIEMRNEVTGIGRVVVYYNNCPRRIYDDLRKIEEAIVEEVNRNFKGFSS